jgi:membrane protein YdbS with pleckstrin-like domain
MKPVISRYVIAAYIIFVIFASLELCIQLWYYPPCTYSARPDALTGFSSLLIFTRLITAFGYVIGLAYCVSALWISRKRPIQSIIFIIMGLILIFLPSLSIKGCNYGFNNTEIQTLSSDLTY